MKWASLLLLACGLQAAPLFDGGRWYGPVVLPAAPSDDEWRAARTLQEQCERVTGVRPELVTEGAGPVPPVGLFVGRTAAFAATGIAVPDPEGDLLMTAVRGDRVFILGDSGAATRMSVGRFAEKTLGVIFLTPGPDGADWSPLTRVVQPEGEVFRPAFAWRSVGGLSTEADEEWACNVGYGPGLTFSHGMFLAFGPREWREDPELFVAVDGRRTAPAGSGYEPNPEFSHPRSAEVGARFTREWFHRHPDAFCAPLGVNDTTEFGDAAPSAGWYRDRPVRTDLVAGFLNSVADSFWNPSGDLGGERRAIGTLAYFHTLAAPTIPVRPAVFPWVCLDRSGHADPEFARQDEANLAAWARSGARRTGAYDYWHGAGYAVPHVDFTAQASAIRAAHRAGVKGWYAELYPLWIFDAPKAWLGSRLLADPSADADALLDGWFAAAYGSAGPSLRSVYRVIERAWSDSVRADGARRGLPLYMKEASARLLSDGQAAEISAQVAAASAAAHEGGPRDDARRRRVQRFAEAWRLVLQFRRVVAARDAMPLTAPRAVRALTALTEAEDAFAAAERAFNLRQCFHGSRVRWSEFLRTNPRPAWIRLAASEPGPRADLASWAARESRLGALAAYALTASSAELEPLHAVAFDSVADRSGLLRIDEHRLNFVRWQEGLLSVRAPSGGLSPRRAFPVVPGTPLVLSAALADGEPGSEVRLVLRFPGSRRRPQESVLAGPRGGELVTVVPPDATAVEYEVAFERSLELREVILSAAPTGSLR